MRIQRYSSNFPLCNVFMCLIRVVEFLLFSIFKLQRLEVQTWTFENIRDFLFAFYTSLKQFIYEPREFFVFEFCWFLLQYFVDEFFKPAKTSSGSKLHLLSSVAIYRNFFNTRIWFLKWSSRRFISWWKSTKLLTCEMLNRSLIRCSIINIFYNPLNTFYESLIL